jgi:HD-GYP domain-containing protein (c-di-GMP phosphodiesterase class II)
VATGISHIYERFDGKGIPGGLRGEGITLPARVVHVAAVGCLAHLEAGREAAVTAVRRRSGGHLDPALAAVFLSDVAELLDDLETGDALVGALEAEPAPHACLPAGELARLALAFADFADLKSPWTLGHSSRTAELAAGACDGATEDEDALRLAGLLHDLGRVSVSNGIWDRAGPLSAGEWERVRLHPHWTHRILARTPVFRDLAALAAADHERLDGSGYHRGLDAAALDRRARLLAVADAYTAMTSDRPHRAALTPAAAAVELRAEACAGRLCPSATEAVLAAAGHVPQRRAGRPHGLTDREVEVLRWAARGLTNKEIAAQLVVSPRTVQHHLAHVYEKTGRRTRAGAALFAVEHGLVTR